MKWIVVNESQFGSTKGQRIYWNEIAGEWTVNRNNAREFTSYQEANICAEQEGGWITECKCTTTETQKLESSTP